MEGMKDLLLAYLAWSPCLVYEFTLISHIVVDVDDLYTFHLLLLFSQPISTFEYFNVVVNVTLYIL
jgi:hypothetical protein